LVIISTCNRVEIYGVTSWAAFDALRLFRQLTDLEVDLTPYVYIKENAEAVRHLLSVAGGLDSLVLGETEITGQVKQAYLAAKEAGLTGKVTNRLFQTALQVAKEIRTQTQVGRGATSVGSVAVELAEKIFDHDLSDKTVLIVGAGKMGEACVRHLAKRGPRSVLVANRSFDRAELLASEFGGRAVKFEELLGAVAQADIVVSSTGCPHTILHRSDLARVLPQRGGRPLFLIDIAVPRDIDPEVEELSNVFLYNVDHLESIVRENLRLRQQELARCETILTERTNALMNRLAADGERAGSRPAPVDASWAGEAAAA
jgi:glutamyl-tRNA reductase